MSSLFVATNGELMGNWWIADEDVIWIGLVISFQKIYGLCGTKGHIVERRWYVTFVHWRRNVKIVLEFWNRIRNRMSVLILYLWLVLRWFCVRLFFFFDRLQLTSLPTKTRWHTSTKCLLQLNHLYNICINIVWLRLNACRGGVGEGGVGDAGNAFALDASTKPRLNQSCQQALASTPSAHLVPRAVVWFL